MNFDYIVSNEITGEQEGGSFTSSFSAEKFADKLMRNEPGRKLIVKKA